jgi:nicotinamidase-related amidase
VAHQTKVAGIGDLSEWRNYAERLPPYGPVKPLDPGRVALVVVDTQYSCSGRHSTAGAFLRDNFPSAYTTYFDRVEQVMIPSIRRLTAHFREHKRQIIFLTVSSHLPDGRDFHPLRRLREEEIKSEFGGGSVLIGGNPRETRILDELAPQPGDLVLNKVSNSAFTSTGIDQILHNMGITSLVFTGVVTNGCVLMTALDAGDRSYSVVIVEDACAAVDDFLHYAPLLIFHHGVGRVLSVAEVIDELNAPDTVLPRQVSLSTESPRGFEK